MNIEVRTQAELNAALQTATKADFIVCRGNGVFWLYGSAQVTAYDSAQVTASKFVAVTTHGTHVGVTGGQVIAVSELASIDDWLEFHGVEVAGDGIERVAVLFKAVRADYRSSHGFLYAPGTTPAAPDWDEGKAECGGGLHFCANPVDALGFDSEATRFLACPVLVSEIAWHANAMYPNKVKARAICQPLWECDINGNRIAVEAQP